MTTTEEEGVLSTDARARWARVAALGFLMAGLGPLLMLGAAVGWGLSIGDDAPFFLVASALGLAGSALVRRAPMWLRIAGLVVGLLCGLLVFWTVFGLFTPDSFFDFVPGVLVLPGVLIGVGFGIAAIVAQRKGKVSVETAGAERTILTLVPLLVVALAAVSAAVTYTSRETVADDVQFDRRVQMSDFEFDSLSYDVEGGDVVLIVNDDPFHHTFTVDALDLDVKLGPGSEKVITIPDEPGEYVLYCEPHTSDPDNPSDDDMAARLEVG